MICNKCHKERKPTEFYDRHLSCKYCFFDYMREYQRKKRAEKKAAKINFKDDESVKKWNRENPMVFTACRAFVEHRIYNGFLTV